VGVGQRLRLRAGAATGRLNLSRAGYNAGLTLASPQRPQNFSS
jgi:hypothetical protein